MVGCLSMVIIIAQERYAPAFRRLDQFVGWLSGWPEEIEAAQVVMYLTKLLRTLVRIRPLPVFPQTLK